MSFFDLIEKEEVFLNEYLLFQKNKKYDKYTNEIKRFFKVKKVTSRKTFYTQPHDITFLQNTFINLDSRKNKKYYYFMYNSDWSPNQQKMLLHNSQHISKYFCLDDEICQRLIDLKSTTCANIFSLKGKNSHEFNFISSPVQEFEFQNCDLVLSYYTMQFVHPKFRQKIINNIFQSLNWGGGFFFFEKVGR